jgi:SAM-dependent methyltransferase
MISLVGMTPHSINRSNVPSHQRAPRLFSRQPGNSIRTDVVWVRAVKRLVRRWIPRRRHWLLDDSPSQQPRDDDYAALYQKIVALTEPEALSSAFVAQRYEEGRRWRTVISGRSAGSRTRILDVGGGNGAIEVALAADPQIHVVSVDRLWNETARRFQRESGAAAQRVLADAVALPFRDRSFDVTTCFEFIEHTTAPRDVAREIARVSRPRGVVLLTTPARWRFAFRGDPHFGVPFLVLLPSWLQRKVSAFCGFRAEHHYVAKLYGSLREIEDVFEGFALTAVLNRGRFPSRWFWDAIVLTRVLPIL